MKTVWLLDDSDLDERLRWHQRVLASACETCPRRLPHCPHHICPVLVRHADAVNTYFTEVLWRQRARRASTQP